MKYKICFFIIIYLATSAYGEMLCKDSLTNEEFIANDALTDAGLKNLQNIFEQKITKSIELLTTTMTKNMNQLEERLKSQLLNKCNNLECGKEMKNDLEFITTLLVEISNKLKIQDRIAAENTENMEKHMNALILQNSTKFASSKNFSSTVKLYNEHESNKTLNSIHNQNELGNGKTKPIKWPTNCKEAMSKTQQSGIYEIQLPAFGPTPFKVLCDNEKPKGNWTIVMRRVDGSIDFYRDWTEYKNGFGNLDGEFFIGLEKLHLMTSSLGRQELLILMKDTNDDMHHILYDNFALGNEDEGYMIEKLGEFTGTVGDNLKKKIKFTTKDVNTDEQMKCAHIRYGPGWYFSCDGANLFGLYNSTNTLRYMGWDRKLQSAEMLIRPHK